MSACNPSADTPAASAETSTEASSTSDAPDMSGLSEPASLALSCSGCHGAKGGAIANLDGYTAADLSERLMAYKTDAEGTTVMHRLMRGYSDAEIQSVSAYIAGDTE
ncbi:c-type cytochrome [Henriciella litoralis]|uniref:c-type cytochrome n=1 Tax=Henriciella litoralis TaxID=568102 RepID=UPI00111C7927|nr:c-type cytochrome [Henriciella litoralis]